MRPRPILSLVILTGLNLFNYLDRQVLAAVLTPMKAGLSLTDSAAGWASTAFMLGYFLTSPFFGYLGDVCSRKWLSAFGVFVWSLGTLLTGLSTNFTTLLACRVLVGLGEASYATLAPGWLADLFAAERRNNALTIFYIAVPVGSAIGYVVGGAVAQHYGWRWAFAVAGAPGLILAASLLFLKEPARGAMDEPELSHAPSRLPSLRDILGLLTIYDFNLILLGYTAYTFALGAFAFWGPTFLVRAPHNLSNQTATSFFGAVLVVAGLLGTLAGGFAASAWQRRNPAGYAWTLALSIAACVPISLTAFLVSNTALAMTFLGLSMFVIFLPTGPINTLLLETVPLNLRASAMAMSIFVIHLFGDFWSPMIVGALADLWNSLARAVLILPAALGVGAVFWFALALKHRAASAPAAGAAIDGGFNAPQEADRWQPPG